MLKSIKTSESNRTVVAELTNKLNMGPENIIARIALAYSISLGQKLNLAQMADSKGKEYSSNVLFGDYADLYKAIVCQHYNLYKDDPDISRYIKIHIDDGLELISKYLEDNPNLLLFDFILEQVEKGLAILTTRVIHRMNRAV